MAITGLSTDTIFLKNPQAGNFNLSSAPVSCIPEFFNFNNKTVSPVEYSGDIFVKQTESSHTQNIYIANDGKEYDIKEILLNRVMDFYLELNIEKNITNSVKKTFNRDNAYKIYEKYLRADEIGDVSEIFYKLTGFKYNNSNIERFLAGDIKLKFEIAAYKYTGKEVKNLPIPYISKYYVSENTLKELKSSRTMLHEEEKEQFESIKNLLSPEYQQKITNILNNGQLLQDKSEGNITILTSLYKIATEGRADKIDNIQLLKDCIDILDNPYVITQNAENIPEEYQEEFSKRYIASEIKRQEKLVAINEKIFSDINLNLSMSQSKIIDETDIEKRFIDERKEEVFQYRTLGTCAAASIEFDLATKFPAEFFRMLEGLTAKDKNVTKNIEINDFNKSRLTFFNTTYETINDKQAKIIISADENAYLLAEIQNKYKDEHERSIVDIIMQSAIMNLGSMQTYNSIDDTREPNVFSQYNGGLAADEVSFAREILTSEVSFCNIYKNLDENRIVSDLYEQKNVKNEILRALQRKDNVVAGLIYTDSENRCLCGHEITIIGYTTNLQGQGFFIIQDSDDEQQKPITMLEEEFLKMLHHAIL